MKKIVAISIVLLSLTLAINADAETKFRAFTCLIGGTTGCLDKLSDAVLVDGDIAFVTTADYFYVFRFDAAAETAENSPLVIRPDDYNTGVWELVGLYGAAIAGVPSTAPAIIFKDSDATAGDDNAKIYVNCTDVGNGSEDCDIYFQSQTAGELTTRITIDADGNVIIDKAQIGDVDGTGAITVTGLSATRAKTFSDAAATVVEVAQTTITKTEFLPIAWAVDGATAPSALTAVTGKEINARSFTEADDVVFWWIVPNDYDGGIKYRVLYALAANASTDDTAVFSMAGSIVANSGDLDGSAGTALTISDELTTDDDQYQFMATDYSAESNADWSLAAGGLARLNFSHAAASDMAGAGEPLVIGIEIKYKSKIVGVAGY